MKKAAPMTLAQAYQAMGNIALDDTQLAYLLKTLEDITDLNKIDPQMKENYGMALRAVSLLIALNNNKSPIDFNPKELITGPMHLDYRWEFGQKVASIYGLKVVG